MSERTPLTSEEREEKARFKAAFNKHKGAWEAANGKKLTQIKLAEIAGCELQGEPYSQGMIWQCLTPEKDTKMPVKLVQFVASLLGFDPATIGPSFAIPAYLSNSKTVADDSNKNHPPSQREVDAVFEQLTPDEAINVIRDLMDELEPVHRVEIARLALAGIPGGLQPGDT